jgi:hypothetical protein
MEGDDGAIFPAYDADGSRKKNSETSPRSEVDFSFDMFSPPGRRSQLIKALLMSGQF